MNIQPFFDSILSDIGPFIPRLIGAIVVLVIAWVIANIVKGVISRVGASTNLDSRAKSNGLTATLANTGYWLTWLMALPIILGNLGLTGLLTPVQNLIDQLLGFLPKLAGAAVILGVGLFVARMVRQIITNLLNAAGAEKLAHRLGAQGSFGSGGLAGLAGTVVFVLIMLPVITAALQPLGLESVTRPVSSMLDSILNMLPRLITASIVIGLSWVIGRVIADSASSVLSGVCFDNVFHKLGLGNMVKDTSSGPSTMVGRLVLFGIMLVAITQAADIVGLTMVSGLVSSFGAVAAQVLSGVVVLGVGLWLANAAANTIKATEMENAGTLARVARVGIIVLTVAMALRQMGVASDITNWTFGALAVAAAVAFGLGGRDAAGRLVNKWVDKLEG